MQFKNLTIIGTSHIAKQSLQEVTYAIEHGKPDIVALELDRRRLYSLTHEVKRKLSFPDILKIGVKGFIFNVIGAWVEKKLGKMVGVEPGSEMITAINLAKKKNIQIALIDQDIEITLQRVSKELRWQDKLNLFIDVIKGILFRNSELKKLGVKDLDLTKVPPKALIKKLTAIMKERYPGLYKVLIEERNNVMAANLKGIIDSNPEKNILAIIGAGHEEEIIALLEEEPKITFSYNYPQ